MAKSVFNRFDTKLQNELRANLDAEDVTASGAAANSLRSEVTETRYTLYGAEHWKFIDKGRGAGGVPRGFIGILQQWIKTKGLSVGEKEDRRFAGAIAYKIRTEGSSKRRGSRPATNIVEKSIEASMPILKGEIITSLKQEYKSEVLSYLKGIK